MAVNMRQNLNLDSEALRRGFDKVRKKMGIKWTKHTALKMVIVQKKSQTMLSMTSDINWFHSEFWI